MSYPQGESVDLNSKKHIKNLMELNFKFNSQIKSTPLVQTKIPNLYLKLENKNPTHSFKYRAVKEMVLDAVKKKYKKIFVMSSGNAGIALSYLAKKYKMESLVYIDPNSKTKSNICKKFGAKISYNYPRKTTSDMFLELVATFISKWDYTWGFNYKLFFETTINKGWYAAQPSIFINCHSLLGYSYISYEIYNQLNLAPQFIITPVINSENAMGQWLGYYYLYKSKKIKKIPTFVLVEKKKKIKHFNYPNCWETIKNISNIQTLEITNEEEETAQKTLKQNGIIAETISAGAYAAYFKLLYRGIIKESNSVVAIISGGNV